MSSNRVEGPAQKHGVGRRAFVLANVVAVLVTVIVISVSRAAVSDGSFDVVQPGEATPKAVSSSLPPAATEIPTAEELGSGHSLGSPDAPVTVIEFAEFQCGVCQNFFLRNEQQLRQSYLDTGKIRFVFKHFVMFGEESMQAALSSEAAAEQGKFWEYHDLLMQVRASPEKEDLTTEKLQGLAEQLGLDMEAFNASVQSGKHREKIDREFSQGRAMGVRGAPTFFVHGGAGEGVTRKGEGDISFKEFKALIDSLLEESDAE